jgi:hypothetical protein
VWARLGRGGEAGCWACAGGGRGDVFDRGELVAVGCRAVW